MVYPHKITMVESHMGMDQNRFYDHIRLLQGTYNVRPPSDVSWLTKAPVTIVICVPQTSS